jgi:hypothetical protein
MKEIAADMHRAGRATLWLCLLLAGGLFVIANAHLVYVATNSQPACVVHVRTGDRHRETGQFSAADSSCSSPTNARGDLSSGRE